MAKIAKFAMGSKDFQYSKEYAQASKAEQQMLDALSDILFEVQYAKRGHKAAARRKASLGIVYTVKTAYKAHRGIL